MRTCPPIVATVEKATGNWIVQEELWLGEVPELNALTKLKILSLRTSAMDMQKTILLSMRHRMVADYCNRRYSTKAFRRSAITDGTSFKRFKAAPASCPPTE